MRGKTELVGTKLWINEWNKPPHPFKLIQGEISEYTLIHYRKKGYKDMSWMPVNITKIEGNQLTIDFVGVVPGHNWKDYTAETIPTSVHFTKTGTIL